LHALQRHPLLDCDIEEAALYYRAKDAVVADRFLTAVENALCFAMEDPERFSQRYAGVRRIRLHGFPQSFYFSIERDVVWVFALIHGAQDATAILSTRITPSE